MIRTLTIVMLIASVGCRGNRDDRPRFPAVADWPATALSACATFRNAAETNRDALATDVAIAFRGLKGKGEAYLTPSDVKSVLGRPSNEQTDVLHYTTWTSGSDAGTISFWFERGRLIRITEGAGELMPKGVANNGADPIR